MNFVFVMKVVEIKECLVIISDLFYFNYNGYKFEVELYLNGYYIDDDFGSKGKFMLIYFRIFVGEYDGFLIWLFYDLVVFMLFD